MRDGDLEYDLHMIDGVSIVHVAGIQVGCFTVRYHDGAWGKMRARMWSIDHWMSGSVVISSPSFDIAIALADDMSRFSNMAPSFTDRNENLFWEHMGIHMQAWLGSLVDRFDSKEQECGVVHKFTPFRDWAVKQGANPVVILRRQPALEVAA